MKHFTHFRDIGPELAKQFITRARQLKAGVSSNALNSKILGMLFMDPSLRTRTSFDAAAIKLGGQAISLDVGQGVWGLEFLDNVAMNGDKPEHVKEAAGVLSQYVDVLGVRAFSHGEGLASDEADRVIGAFRKHAKVPVISLESAREHPCQGLADMMAAQEAFGDPKTGDLSQVTIALTWAPHVKSLPRAVPNSVLLSAAAMGAKIKIAHPLGYALAPEITAEAMKLAQLTGAKIDFYTQQASALKDAQVVYAKSWGQTDALVAPPNDPTLANWMLTPEHFKDCAVNAAMLHCLPVRRGVEVSHEVLDGPHAQVLNQAGNRLWVQMAALEYLVS
jgi:N-acetylornithine carbamoyltransferase